ncbi:uncharacterized protein LOC100367270 [Saccoglossus kowalevskii]|uniref:HMG domain-containing protein 4-like n=1 Tax=Saccoglossus kowalevskii TaxID=10224 RepID=A0ABM0GSS1_SACKO|nr:PREDICTED: HMG domain-containing protein 4-like [Saccoglossus kowalevskii]
MSSRQSVKRRRTSDYEDADFLTEKKSTKRSKRTTESASTSKSSMSPDSGDDTGDWSSYEQTLNRPTRVRKKSAKLLEAENIDHDFEKWKSSVASSFPSTDVYAEIDERSSSKKDSRYKYSEAKIPDVKITLGKDRDDKGSKKSKDKKKRSDIEESSFLEMDFEARHKSKKSKKSLPAPIPSISETSFTSKEKESGIKLKLILSPKEKEKAEAIYEISSPEADLPTSLEKRKKKKKEKMQARAKLIFEEDFDVPESKKKKNKKKKRSSDEREIAELTAEIVSDAGTKEKLLKKKKKKSHSGQASNGFTEPDVLLESELIIDEKPTKEKKKKQKKEKKEKEKKKSKDKSKDKVKIKLKLNEKNDDMFGIDSESHFEMAQSTMPSSELFPMGLKPLSGDDDTLQHLKQPSTAKKTSKPLKPKKDKKGKKLKGDKKKDKKEKKEKKPLSAYMLWCNHYRSKLVADNPGIDFSTISKKLGAIWHTLTEKEKAKWKRKQKAQKTKHKNVPNLSKNRQELKDKAAKQRGTSPARKSGSPMKSSDAHTQPIDMAAHLKLLGESLSLVGNRLQEHQGNIEVHGSLSVLLDSTLCAITPLVGLTSQVKELDGCIQKTQVSTLDNIAYIMPGL